MTQIRKPPNWVSTQQCNPPLHDKTGATCLTYLLKDNVTTIPQGVTLQEHANSPNIQQRPHLTVARLTDIYTKRTADFIYFLRENLETPWKKIVRGARP